MSINEWEKNGKTCKTLCSLIYVTIEVFYSIFLVLDHCCSSAFWALWCLSLSPKALFSLPSISPIWFILLHYYKLSTTLRLEASLCLLLYNFTHSSIPSVSPTSYKVLLAVLSEQLTYMKTSKTTVKFSEIVPITYVIVSYRIKLSIPMIRSQFDLFAFDFFPSSLIMFLHILCSLFTLETFFQNIYFPPLCFALCSFPQCVTSKLMFLEASPCSGDYVKNFTEICHLAP